MRFAHDERAPASFAAPPVRSDGSAPASSAPRCASSRKDAMEHQHGLTRDLQGEALLDPSGNVWLPFDLPHLRNAGEGWRPLSSRRTLRHPLRACMRPADHATDALHVINGMGVTLGDSIIGMNALAWLKARQ